MARRKGRARTATAPRLARTATPTSPSLKNGGPSGNGARHLFEGIGSVVYCEGRISSFSLTHKKNTGLATARFTSPLVSPTHKRTEGRAPVWGSELTSKDAALQGGSIRNRCRLNVKLRTSVTGACFFTPCLRIRNMLIPFAGLRSCWFVLLYFAPCRPLPRPRRP